MVLLTISLIIFLVPLAYSPGPGNMIFAVNGARFGFVYTVAANTGYHVATLAVTLAIGIFFSKVSNLSPEVFSFLKVLGAVYVFFLAWTIANAGAPEEGKATGGAGYWGRFFEGVILLLFNPKAYLIMILLFSQFLPANEPNNLTTVIWMSVIFTLNNMIAFGVWAYAGDRLARKFRNKESSIRLNRLFGLLLVMVAFWMLIA